MEYRQDSLRHADGGSSLATDHCSYLSTPGSHVDLALRQVPKRFVNSLNIPIGTTLKVQFQTPSISTQTAQPHRNELKLEDHNCIISNGGSSHGHTSDLDSSTSHYTKDSHVRPRRVRWCMESNTCMESSDTPDLMSQVLDRRGDRVAMVTPGGDRSPGSCTPVHGGQQSPGSVGYDRGTGGRSSQVCGVVQHT